MSGYQTIAFCLFHDEVAAKGPRHLSQLYPPNKVKRRYPGMGAMRWLFHHPFTGHTEWPALADPSPRFPGYGVWLMRIRLRATHGSRHTGTSHHVFLY